MKCFQEHCPPLNCSDPTKEPGACCSECPQVCFDKGSNKTYQEDEMWEINTGNVCKICTCKVIKFSLPYSLINLRVGNSLCTKKEI